MFGIPMTHIVLLLIVGVLLFGKRLPEVARSVGKMLIELKKGWAGLEDNLMTGNFFEEPRREAAPPPPPPRPPQRVQPTSPKFEEPPPSASSTPSSPIV
jgi:sec-independent protein translocase protein TatA